MYCCPSCKTLASNARRRTTMGKPTPLAAPIVAAGSAPPLSFDLQTVGVVAAGTAVGTLGLRVVDHLFSNPSPPPAGPLPPVSVAAEREDPANWLPAGLLTAAVPRVPLEVMSGGPAVIFVQLQYLGHTLYYQPSQRVLLWRSAPGQLRALLSAAQVAQMAEQLPCQEQGPGQAPLLNPSGQLKILG
jgi:hypothetical protein